MNQNDILKAFDNLGWKVGKDEVGDSFCCREIGGYLVDAMPRLRQLPDCKVLDVSYSVSVPEFNDIVAEIFDKKTRYRPIVEQDEMLQSPDFEIKDIRMLSERIITWAQNQDIAKIVEHFRISRPDRPGQKQLYHLAALVQLGDVAKLQEYQDCMRSGDRLNFVPMISNEVVDRALKIAVSRTS